MEEVLGFDNILGENDILDMFSDTEETSQEEKETTVEKDSKEEEKEEDKTTEVVDPNDLFEEEEKQPESVGSGKDKEEKGKEGSSTEDGGGTSPNQNFYSSIANAVAEDGVFPNLDEETIKKASDAESFSKLFDLEVEARLDDAQKRIKKALDNSVEPSDIRRFENTLNYLSSITDKAISEESEKGEELRKNLIYQDFLNKGYSPEKAQKYMQRSIDSGVDVEDAKEALLSNKEFFQDAYDKLLEDAQKKADEEKAERQKQSEKLKDSIMTDKQLFGDMEISNDIRKKAFENISKPVYKDPETGEYMTAIQKYEMEHRAEFLKYAGLFFTLTNGFKDFESFTKGKVKKEVNKGLRELEKVFNSTSRTPSGNLKMVTGVNPDPESFFNKGLQLDI